MSTLNVKEEALHRLYAPWEEPNAHRQGTETVAGRRLSQMAIVNSLRESVGEWRRASYEGASETSRTLLTHWFGGAHRQGESEFRYYFCQREAIETLIYLYEVQQVRTVSRLIHHYDDPLRTFFSAPAASPPRLRGGYEAVTENAWPKYAFKLATGTGKTKCMSLAIVWSYFHALREPNSDMTTRFLVIAPGLTVYERLLEDFGGGKIFETDPLIPPEWKNDWHLNVIEQNEPGGAGTGVLYLTNIQKLYPKRRGKAQQYHRFMGPTVTPTASIDIGAALRERISEESRLMVLNDEAHHIWHPDLAWNQAIAFFHDKTDGLVTQLDFSATPKDQRGNLFRHTVCDTPLGEAVDAGIVKVPIIGEADLEIAPSDNAAEKYRAHLEVGYKRWQASYEEWEKDNKKALLFVMCENTPAADAIAKLLNTDPFFEKLNGKTLNLHTNLKGRVNKRGEFIENERQMSDADLKRLRELSRALDSDENPYACIVSVLMLRAGWDVKNVTTIVPLRPFTSDAKILPEQTLGRGLRRMTPPGSDEVRYERLVVIEHPAFRSLYEEALGSEGVATVVQQADRIGTTTVSIYPEKNGTLEVAVPQLSDAHRVNSIALRGLTCADVEARCRGMSRLKLAVSSKFVYTGALLLTQEVVEWMQLSAPLLSNGWTAISYFVKQLERTCRLPAILHRTIAPLLEHFLTALLFEESLTLTDERLIQRLGDPDVADRIHAVFEPLILERIIRTEPRLPTGTAPLLLSRWQPYLFTASAKHPAILASKTLFNLVPCHSHFEAEFAGWLDRAEDVDAFAKNAGPQALRIDYLNASGRIARYIPDFFVRDSSGAYFLVETKGYPDGDAREKASAAVSWCRAASTGSLTWKYLFVHQTDWNSFYGRSFAELLHHPFFDFS